MYIEEKLLVDTMKKTADLYKIQLPEKYKENFDVSSELGSFVRDELAIPKLMSGLGTSVKKCPN